MKNFLGSQKVKRILAIFVTLLLFAVFGEEVLLGKLENRGARSVDERSILEPKQLLRSLLRSDAFEEEILGQQSGQYFVERVVDGDTFVLADGKKVRLIGVDTPESKKPGTPVECFAIEASNFLQELIEGKWVRLERDVSDTDRYGRLLRYVYIDTGGSEVFVNAHLVKNGYASATSFSPDIAYEDIFRQLEKNARNAGVGLWASCD